MLWQFSDDHEFTKEIAVISEFYVMFKSSSIFLWSIDVYVLVFEVVNKKGIYDFAVWARQSLFGLCDSQYY